MQNIFGGDHRWERAGAPRKRRPGDRLRCKRSRPQLGDGGIQPILIFCKFPHFLLDPPSLRLTEPAIAPYLSPRLVLLLHELFSPPEGAQTTRIHTPSRLPLLKAFAFLWDAMLRSCGCTCQGKSRPTRRPNMHFVDYNGLANKKEKVR